MTSGVQQAVTIQRAETWREEGSHTPYISYETWDPMPFAQAGQHADYSLVESLPSSVPRAGSNVPGAPEPGPVHQRQVDSKTL